MASRWKEPAWFWRAFAVGATVSLLAPVALAPLEAEWASARTFQIALVAAAALWALAAKPRLDALFAAAVPRWAEVALAAASLGFFLACQATRFLAADVNGIDFSIFDWMIHNAHLGKGMFSPIYGVNHLGVHPTWLLYLWVPLHAAWDSPWWLVISNALVLWAGLFPLRWLVRALGLSPAWGLLAAFAWLTNPWLGRLVDGGFRPESLYPAAGLLLALAWVKGRALPLALAVLLYLAVKEDAALHLVGLSLGALLFARARWREAAAIGAASAAVLALHVGYVQPALLAPYGVRQPTWVTFWGHYGGTPAEIAAAMLGAPWRVVADVATSSWFKFFLPALGLPLSARLPAAAMVPVIFLLGTSGAVAMHDYRAYYPVPLLAFALWGLLEVAARPAAAWRKAALAALLLFPLFGGGTPRVAWPEPGMGAELAQLRARVDQSRGLVCTQTILFPQLGYRAHLVELSPDCLADPGSIAVLHPFRSPWPYKREQLEQWISGARAEGRLEELPGGYAVLGPPGSAHVPPDGEPGGHGDEERPAGQ